MPPRTKELTPTQTKGLKHPGGTKPVRVAVGGFAEANATCVRCVLSVLNLVSVRWLYVQASYSTTDAV